MKKAIRYMAIAGCIALFLFLMLPFLVPPSLEQINTTNQQEQTASPQIFTANPLTKILSRIAHLLKRHQTPRQPSASQPAATNQTAQRTQGVYSPAKKSAYQGEDFPPENENVSQAAAPAETPDETLPENDPDNWFLTRQETPDRSPTGMHEINVKDTPYNRFMKQERLARISPVTQINKPTEVPDSKIAKLFQPFTQWWTGKKQVSSPMVASAGNNAKAHAVTSADKGLNRHDAKQPSALPKAQIPDISTSVKSKAKSQSGLPNYTLTDLINPSQTIRESAHMLTQAAYETPGDAPAPNISFGEFQQIQFDQTSQQVADRLHQHLLILSDGAQPEDQLGKTVNCDITKGLISEQGFCEPLYDENDLAIWRENNRQEFLAQTNIPLPPSQMTPVLGIAEQNTLPKMQGNEDDEWTPGSAQTKEIYRFMLEGNNCSSNNCYWVANSLQQHKSFPDTFTAAGVEFAGDPLHVYDRVRDNFTTQKLAELPPDATEEQRQQIIRQPEVNAPPYVLYTQQDMQQLRQQLQQDPTRSLYVASAADANALAESWNYATPFFYGRQAQPLTIEEAWNVEQRAHTLMLELAEDVIFMQGVMQDVQREAAQGAISGKSSPIAQQIQKQLADEQAQWEATRSMGKTQK